VAASSSVEILATSAVVAIPAATFVPALKGHLMDNAPAAPSAAIPVEVVVTLSCQTAASSSGALLAAL